MAKQVKAQSAEEYKQERFGSGQIARTTDYLKKDPASYYHELLKNSRYYRDNMWSEAAIRGELPNLIQYITDSEKNGNPNFDRYLQYESMSDYETYMSNLATASADNETPKKRVDPETGYYYGDYTDKEWLEKVLDSTYQKYEFELEKQRKENATFWEHVGAFFVTVGTGIEKSAFESAKGILDIVSGLKESAFYLGGKIFGNETKWESLGQAFTAGLTEQEGTGDLVTDALRFLVNEPIKALDYVSSQYQKDYMWTTYYDQDGNLQYTEWGQILNSSIDFVGMLLPSIGAGKLAKWGTKGLAPKVSSSVQRAARQSAFYLPIFSRYANQSVTQIMTDTGCTFKDINSGEVITNAALKTVAEWGIERLMARFLRTTTLDKMVGADSIKAVGKVKDTVVKSLENTGASRARAFGATVGRLAADAGKEGLEEVLQDFSTGLIDIAFGGSYAKQGFENLTFKNLMLSFTIGALVSTVVGSVNDLRYAPMSQRIKEGVAVGVGEDGKPYKLSYFQALTFKDAMDKINNWNYIINDESAKLSDRINANLKLAITMDAIASVAKLSSTEDFLEAAKLLDAKYKKDKDKVLTSRQTTIRTNKVNKAASKAEEMLNNFYAKQAENAAKYIDDKQKEAAEKALEKNKDALEKAGVDEVTNIITKKVDAKDKNLNIAEEKVETLKKALDEIGVDMVVGVNGNIVIKSENVLIASDELVKTADIAELLKGIAFDQVVTTVSNSLTKQQKLLLSKFYEQTVGSYGTEKDIVTALLFDKKFYTKTLLLCGEDVNNFKNERERNEMLKVLSTIDQIINKKYLSKELQNGRLSQKSFDTLINKVRENLKTGLIIYCTQYVNVDFGVISKDIISKELAEEIDEIAKYNKNVIFTNRVNEIKNNIKNFKEGKEIEQFISMLDKYKGTVPDELLNRAELMIHSNNVDNRSEAVAFLELIARKEHYANNEKVVYLPYDIAEGTNAQYREDMDVTAKFFGDFSFDEIVNVGIDPNKLTQEAINFISENGYNLSDKTDRMKCIDEILNRVSNNELTIGADGTILRVLDKHEFLKDEYLGENGNNKLLKDLSNGKVTTVGDITRISNLSNKLKDIKIIKINAGQSSAESGLYSERENTIYVFRDSVSEIIMHELTHATQHLTKVNVGIDYTGSNLNIFKGLDKKTLNDIDNYMQNEMSLVYDYLKYLDPNMKTPMLIYFNTRGEVEARAMATVPISEFGFTWKTENDKRYLVSPDGKKSWEMKANIVSASSETNVIRQMFKDTITREELARQEMQNILEQRRKSSQISTKTTEKEKTSQTQKTVKNRSKISVGQISMFDNLDLDLPDVRQNEKQTPYFKEDKNTIEDRVIERYGKTQDWRETGYITPKGDKIDLSGKKMGGPSGKRTVDHREVFELEDINGKDFDNTTNLIEFMKRGNIRVTSEIPGINLQKEPTSKQYILIKDLISKLGKENGYFVIDIDNEKGYNAETLEYEDRIRPDAIVEDLKSYFEMKNKKKFDNLDLELPDVRQNEKQSRFVSSKYAKTKPGLKGYVRKGQKILMHPDLFRFLYNLTEEDLAKLDKRLQDLILEGKLTYEGNNSINDFVATAKKMGDFTFKKIARDVYQNEELAKLSFEQYEKIRKNIVELSAIEMMLNPLSTTEKRPEAMEALIEKDIINKKMSYNNLMKLMEKINDLSNKSKEVENWYARADEWAQLTISGVRKSGKNIRQKIEPKDIIANANIPMFLHYNGTLRSINHARGSSAQSVFISNKYIEDSEALEQIGITEEGDFKIRSKTYSPNTRLNREYKKATENYVDPILSDATELTEFVTKYFVERTIVQNSKKLGRELTRSEQLKIARYNEEKFSKMPVDELSDYYYKILLTKMNKKNLIKDVDIEITPEGEKKIAQDNLYNNLLKLLREIGEDSTYYDKLPEEIKQYIVLNAKRTSSEYKYKLNTYTKTYKNKKTGEEKKKSVQSFRNLSTDEVLKLLEITRQEFKKIQKIKSQPKKQLEQLKKRAKKLEEQKKIEEEKRLNAEKLLFEEKKTKSMKDKLSEAIEHRTKVVNHTFEIASPIEPNDTVKSLLNTQWTKIKMSEVQGLSVNQDQNVTNAKEFFMQNREVLTQFKTNEDILDAIDYFLRANMLFDPKASIEENNNNIRNFEAIKTYFFGFILEELKKENNIYSFIDSSTKNKIEQAFRLKTSIGMTTGAIWKRVREAFNPWEYWKNADIEIEGVPLTDKEKDRLFTAAQNGDIDEMDKVMREINARVIKEPSTKKSFGRKVIAFRQMAMLSSPLTWLRNLISNMALKRLNKLADKIGGSIFKGHTEEGQLKLNGKVYTYKNGRIQLKGDITKPVQEFINKNFIDNKFFDKIVGNISRYNLNDISPNMRDYKDIAKKDAIFVQMMLKAQYGLYYNEGLFKTKFMNSLHQNLMKVMSDTPWVREATMRYFAKILVEKGYRIDEKTQLTDEIMNDFGCALGLGLADYMHQDNIFTKIENYLSENSEAGLFLWKGIMPFAGAGFQWYKAFLRFSPLGLVNAIWKFTKLEKQIAKAEGAWGDPKKAGSQSIAPEFTEFIIRRQLGQGIIGTILMFAGALLAGLGWIRLEDDDYGTPKLHVGKLKVDVSSIFGSNSLLAGAALVTAFQEEGWTWDGLRESFNRYAASTLDGFPLMSLIELDAYSSDNVGIITRYGENLALSFIPNLVSWIAGITYTGDIKKSNFVYKAFAKIPVLGNLAPKKVDPYTGQSDKGYFWHAIFNRFLPYVSWDLASQTEVTTKGLGLNKQELKGKYTILDEKFELSPKETQQLNTYYGTWNAKDLEEFYTNIKKVRVKVGNKYVYLTYNQMDDTQRKNAVQNIMSSNAELCKIYAWISKGNKYYASDEIYSKLMQKGIKTNIYKGNKGFVKK